MFGVSVFLVFNGMIALGCRVSKARAQHTDGFVSVNVPPVGSVMGGMIRYNLRMEPGALGPDMFPPQAAEGDARSAVGPALLPGVCRMSFSSRSSSGVNPAVFDALARIGVKGLVIEGYGIGSIPFLKRNHLPGVKGLLDRGVAVAITIQSLFDGTDLSLYKVGKECLTMGAIEGRDTTVGVLVVKLMCVIRHS